MQQFDLTGSHSVVFSFAFSSERQIKSACRSISASGIGSDFSVKKIAAKDYVLRVTRVIDFDTDLVDFHKNLLLEDVKGFGATYIDVKLHKIATSDGIKNKQLGWRSRLLSWLFVDTTGKRQKTLVLPFWRIIFLVLAMLVFGLFTYS
ncbi:hypothetical protein MHM98_01075 [Psychrobium sp. MM17-31]|uniref:hypothetical protein n=1 Tax=Psychrobium sp. MM17-31 TaxID=2917758 RepID=UPI001EF62C00|nr:hypothetical protein [Psychrobium sp. MM17-31]MCG7529955.1 hypothetical protein [Psychrobium sp. MM17-31]